MVKRREAMQVLQMRYGYFPRRFCWRGRSYDVVRVERVWCSAREWPRREQRRHYAVLTDAGAFRLDHDLLHNLWSVADAPAQPNPGLAGKGSPERGRMYGNRLALVR